MIRTGGWILACRCMLAVSSLAVAGHAEAGGSKMMRAAERTNIAACQSGKLVEQLHVYAYAKGFSERYALACLKTLKEADWILLSGTSCDSIYYGDDRCFTSKAQLVPQFSAEDPPQNGKNNVRSYNLIRYGFGRECKLVAQAYTAERDSWADKEKSSLWICKSLRVVDGRSSSSYSDPTKLKVFELRTEGKESFAEMSNDDEAQGGPLDIVSSNFAVPETEYRYEIDKEEYARKDDGEE